MAKNAPFKFTREQRNSLIDSWKRKADRQIATGNRGRSNKTKKGYIDTIERIVNNIIVDPLLPAEDKTPQQVREDDKRIIDLSSRLRGALANQCATSKYALTGCLHDIARSQGYGPESDIILEKLIAYLEMLEFVVKSSLEHETPRTARKGDATRYTFMVALVTTYQRSFGKNPSASPAGNFRTFLNTLSNIIDIPLGSDLLKRVIADFKI